MNINCRQNEIKNLDMFINNQQIILNDVLHKLDWKEESLESQMKVPCPRNHGHWVPESALPQHHEICEWIEEGYAREELEKQPPDSSFFYEKAFDAIPVTIDSKTIEQVLSECGIHNHDHSKPLNIPKTYERWTVQFNREQRLAIYDHVVKMAKAADKPKNVNLEDLMIDFEKKEEGEKPKSKLEKLAEMRDYKRRRQSYRAKNVHITKKSYTEIMKEVIENQTSYLAETKKTNDSENTKGEYKDPDRNGIKHSNYYSEESSSEFKEMYGDYEEHRDHARKHHHSRKRSSSHSPKRKKHKRDRSRSRSPSHHKHKKSRKHKRSHD